MNHIVHDACMQTSLARGLKSPIWQGQTVSYSHTILIGLFGFDYAARETINPSFEHLRANDSGPPRTAFATYSNTMYSYVPT